MTIPSLTGLQTALSGLQAAQAQIDTAGQNIANASTPGYSRESVGLTESASLAMEAFGGIGGGAGQLGTGVDVSTISRIRDQFLDIQYRAQNTSTSASNTSSTELQQVQTAVNEPSTDGISNQLSQYWSAWSGLANNPTSTAAQQAVVDAGKSLASSFNSVSGQMATVQSQASAQYAALTGPGGQVETDATQIAALNGQISSATQAGQTPNNLLDQRDQLLDNLSSLAQISVTNQTDGSVTVNFGNNTTTPLVNGTAVASGPLALGSNPGGQLGALQNLTSPTGSVGSLLSSLNTVANQVISSVNALQPTSPFFSGNSASTIAVTATPSSIQSSSSSTSGADLAHSIANLQGGAADSSYGSFVAQVGDGVQSAESTQATGQALLTAIGNQRQSVSGVSLDEEMTNLITSQQAYQASAKVMTTIDSMLDTLINHTGL